jgi:hypothetical protein
MDPRPDPVRPTTEEARALARRLLREARHGALGTVDPGTGGPLVTRVALGWDGAAALVLVSTLALHTRALLADPAASLLVGEPGPRGDPLLHPRLTLQARAEAADKAALRAAWLAAHPKTTLYYDFADFRLFRLLPFAAHLNGGFGQAFRLGPEDLCDPAPAP